MDESLVRSVIMEINLRKHHLESGDIGLLIVRVETAFLSEEIAAVQAAFPEYAIEYMPDMGDHLLGVGPRFHVRKRI